MRIRLLVIAALVAVPVLAGAATASDVNSCGAAFGGFTTANKASSFAASNNEPGRRKAGNTTILNGNPGPFTPPTQCQ